MAKLRRVNPPKYLQTLSEESYEAKVVLIEVTLFLLFLVELLRFLLHVAGPLPSSYFTPCLAKECSCVAG